MPPLSTPPPLHTHRGQSLSQPFPCISTSHISHTKLFRHYVKRSRTQTHHFFLVGDTSLLCSDRLLWRLRAVSRGRSDISGCCRDNRWRGGDGGGRRGDSRGVEGGRSVTGRQAAGGARTGVEHHCWRPTLCVGVDICPNSPHRR